MVEFLRKFLLIALLLAAGGYYWYVRTPCHLPVRYTAGLIDPGFKLSQAQLLDAAGKAEALWEKAAGVNLFEYEKGAPLPINLVYDSRQETTQKNNTLKDAIDQTSESADAIKALYNSAQAKYKKALSDYNAKVAYWNSLGGAPRSEYYALEQQRVSLNAQASGVNTLSAKYNQLAATVNANVSVINQSAGREFEEGLYTQTAFGSTIDIYEYSDSTELVRVLSHEMGHSLGLGHNDNPESIMYPLNQSENLAPTAEDLASLKAVCRL